VGCSTVGVAMYFFPKSELFSSNIIKYISLKNVVGSDYIYFLHTSGQLIFYTTSKMLRSYNVVVLSLSVCRQNGFCAITEVKTNPSMGYWWTITNFAILFQKGLFKGPKFQNFAYLDVIFKTWNNKRRQMSKNTMCPAIYCVKQYTRF
jgi:hypothetical protein